MFLNKIKLYCNNSCLNLTNFNYNLNYTIKCVGYFKNYMYTANDYFSNKSILCPDLIKNQIGILYIINNKDKTEEHLSGILYFEFFYDYVDFINFVDKKITMKLNSINVKIIKHILIVIKIWDYTHIYTTRLIAAAQKEFDKKLLKFQTVVNKLVDYKVTTTGTDKFSRFLAERILNKELKPVLHIKVINEEKQEECLKHLLNLLSKKWPDVKFDVFKFYFYKAIKQHQDNFEHGDMW
jgi:hypothetical protein